MAQKKSKKKTTQTSAKTSAATGKASKTFSDEERAAMRDRVKEMKAAAAGEEEGERAVLAKLAGMTAADRDMGERLHKIIMASAPGLEPRLWYGMPAYAKDGKVVCHFQDSRKFKTRYATLGFSDKASLDEGNVWPCAFALKELTAADEARIGALVKKAVG